MTFWGGIDIDMPVEGDLDEPDFKYGALVVKTLGNLITKAVTSPFRFLGSMMGLDGESLEALDFEAGLANILPPEREKLDSIAKMMLKRPKIILSVGGRYDEEVDTLAIKKQKMAKLVMLRGGNQDKMSVDILEDIYRKLLGDNKLMVLSSNYEDGKSDLTYLKDLLNVCVKLQSVSNSELINLATSRIEALQNYLIYEKGISQHRIKILEVDNVEDSDEKWVKTKLEISIN